MDPITDQIMDLNIEIQRERSYGQGMLNIRALSPEVQHAHAERLRSLYEQVKRLEALRNAPRPWVAEECPVLEDWDF